MEGGVQLHHDRFVDAASSHRFGRSRTGTDTEKLQNLAAGKLPDCSCSSPRSPFLPCHNAHAAVAERAGRTGRTERIERIERIEPVCTGLAVHAVPVEPRIEHIEPAENVPASGLRQQC